MEDAPVTNSKPLSKALLTSIPSEEKTINPSTEPPSNIPATKSPKTVGNFSRIQISPRITLKIKIIPAVPTKAAIVAFSSPPESASANNKLGSW